MHWTIESIPLFVGATDARKLTPVLLERAASSQLQCQRFQTHRGRVGWSLTERTVGRRISGSGGLYLQVESVGCLI